MYLRNGSQILNLLWIWMPIVLKIYGIRFVLDDNNYFIYSNILAWTINSIEICSKELQQQQANVELWNCLIWGGFSWIALDENFYLIFFCDISVFVESISLYTDKQTANQDFLCTCNRLMQYSRQYDQHEGICLHQAR